MKILYIDKTINGFGDEYIRLREDVNKADIVIGKINENRYQILKDREGTLDMGRFYTKEDLFLEML